MRHILTILFVCCLHAAEIQLEATGVRLVEPFAVDFDRQGNWYICEYKGQRITRVGKNGMAGPFAGTGVAGFSGDGGPASAAMLNDPHGLVVTRSGAMYVADTINHVIRKIDLKSGIISTIGGTGRPGFSGDGGPAIKAEFNGTFAVALNKTQDKLFVADLNNRRVRRIDLKAGTVTTVAGNGESAVPMDGGKASQSPLVDPRAVALDSKDNLYILDRRGNALRVVSRDGVIRTVVGPGSVTPEMNAPKHLAVDAKDNVIIADSENHLIRLYSPRTGKTAAIAGTGRKGDKIVAGNPLQTELNRPHGVTVDAAGRLYISDSYNHRVLRLTGY